MKLTVLGSGSFIPVAHRNNPGYLLDIDDNTVLLDCGSGTLRQLANVSCSFWEINSVFLSHEHIDHTADLIPLLFTRKYAPQAPEVSDRVQPLRIYGHADCIVIQKQRAKIHENWIYSDERPFDFVALDESELKGKEFTVQTKHANHTDGSLMYRFTDRDGKTLVYTGDTGYCKNLVEICKNCDLLVIECSFRDGSAVETHMTPKDIGRLLHAASIKRCLITHIYPENDDATLTDRIPHPKTTEILIASDLQTIDI